MSRTVLITGGAGFIGSHLADQLLGEGDQVRVLDSLCPLIHDVQDRAPDYLDPAVELVIGDIRDAEAVRKALRGVDAVVHLAAAMGVGQSRYQMERYTDVNSRGTAVLMDALAAHPVDRLVVASSMSVYGEGCYQRSNGTRIEDVHRDPGRLRAGLWDPADAEEPLIPLATGEDKCPRPASVYALSKLEQEQLCLIAGRTYDIGTCALRFFNVYGPRQKLSNPYTGVLADFAARFLSGRPPIVFEDGQQRRDFVCVDDVAMACRLALVSTSACDQVLNIGSGRPVTIHEVALTLGQAMGRPDLVPIVNRQYRASDVRHCYANIDRAQRLLGYRPEVELSRGLAEMTRWLMNQKTCDRSEVADEVLLRPGLFA